VAFGRAATISTLPLYKDNTYGSVGITYYLSSNFTCSEGRYQVSAVSVLRLRDQTRKRHIRNVLKLFFLIFMFNAVALANVSALLTF
jgi:hypothetical protein